MNRQLSWLVGGTVVVAAALGGVAVAAASGGGVTQGNATGTEPDAPEGPDTPITGSALEQAKAAALAHTGGGRVTETEVGDEESYYEVEVTLDGGRQVDVRLDEKLTVVGSSSDGPVDDK